MRGPGTSHKSGLWVCHTIRRFSPIVGGTELQLERLVPYIAKEGAKVSVLTRAHRGRPRREGIDGGEIRRAPGANLPMRVTNAFYVFGSIWYLLLHRRKVGVVHAHDVHAAGSVALGAHLLGIPTLVKVTKHGVTGDFYRLSETRYGRWLMASLFKKVCFVAPSEEIRHDLLRRGVTHDRIFRIPNGVILDLFYPPPNGDRQAGRTELGLPDSPLALFLGRLVWQKHIDTLIKALAEVPDLILLLVGDGPERPGLERLARELDVTDRVKFLGENHPDRVPDLLRAADMMLFSTRAEAFSNAILEAMACGTTPVCAPTSGVPEMLGQEERGLIVDSDDVEGWQREMRRLIDDPETRRRLGKQAAEFVAETYPIERTAQVLVETYRRLVGRD